MDSLKTLEEMLGGSTASSLEAVEDRRERDSDERLSEFVFSRVFPVFMNNQ